jgi:hypothetical protein
MSVPTSSCRQNPCENSRLFPSALHYRHSLFTGDALRDATAGDPRISVRSNTGRVLGVEDEDGQHLGAASPLDGVANVQRRRRKPQPPSVCSPPGGDDNAVELAYRRYHGPDREVR